MDGGAQSNARYAMAVDLPTNSRKTYVLHAQPPAFGRNVKVDLVADGQDDRERHASPTSSTTRPSSSSACSPSGRRALVSQIKLPVEPDRRRPRPIVPLTVARPAGARRGLGASSTGWSGRTSTATSSPPEQLTRSGGGSPPAAAS